MNRRSFLALLGSALVVKPEQLIANPEPIVRDGDAVPFAVTGQTPDVWIPYMICEHLTIAAGQILDEILFPPPQPVDFIVNGLSILYSVEPDGLFLDVRAGEHFMINPAPLALFTCGNYPFPVYPAWAFKSEHPMSIRLSGIAPSEIEIRFGLHGATKATPEQIAAMATYADDDEEEDWDEEEEE